MTKTLSILLLCALGCQQSHQEKPPAPKINAVDTHERDWDAHYGRVRVMLNQDLEENRKLGADTDRLDSQILDGLQILNAETRPGSPEFGKESVALMELLGCYYVAMDEKNLTTSRTRLLPLSEDASNCEDHGEVIK